MSTTVIQYLDPAAVAALQEQAALRAAEKAKQTSDADFSTALSEATKSLTTAEQLASAGSYSSDDLDAIFTEASVTYGVSKDLLKSIAKAESNFNPTAVSHAGAVGIMQLMPTTAQSLGVTNSYDARQNIMGGAKYISSLLSKYNGDTSLALAAYNAGSGNVAKYGGIPPFAETQNYVKKVMAYMGESVSIPKQSPSSVFELLGSHRVEANEMLGDFFSMKNMSKDSLDLLVALLKLSQQDDTNET